MTNYRREITVVLIVLAYSIYSYYNYSYRTSTRYECHYVRYTFYDIVVFPIREPHKPYHSYMVSRISRSLIFPVRIERKDIIMISFD